MHGDCCNTQRSTRNTGDDACRETEERMNTRSMKNNIRAQKEDVIIYSTSRSKLTQHFSFHRRQKENIYAALFHTMKLHEGRWASSKMCHRSGLFDLYSIFNSFNNSLCRLSHFIYENEQREHSAKFLLGSIHMGLEQHENEIIEFTFLVKRFNNIVILLYFINSVTMYIKLNQKEWKR